MAEQFRNPKVNEPLVDGEGKQTDDTFRLLERLSSFLRGLVALRLPAYDDLANVNSAIPKPIKESFVYIRNQGLAVYNGSQWVLAADGTTPIS